MSTPSIPSKPPAIDGDMAGALSFIFKKLLQKTDGQLPAEVVSYNRATNRATVRPLISIIGTNGQRIGRASIAAVPVVAIGGGSFFMNFPLGPGDTGWIEASDRDISLFLQSMQLSPPNDTRIHSFEHGRFMPDVLDKYTYSLDANALVISSLDGTTRLVMSPGKINLIASDVQVNSTTMEINASSSVTVNTGSYNINATGFGTQVTGAVSLPATTVIDGRPFPTHQHSGVQTGTGNSGGIV